MTIIMCWLIANQIAFLLLLRNVEIVPERHQADRHDRYLNHSYRHHLHQLNKGL